MQACTRTTEHGTMGEYSHCGYGVYGLKDDIFDDLCTEKTILIKQLMITKNYFHSLLYGLHLLDLLHLLLDHVDIHCRFHCEKYHVVEDLVQHEQI